LTLTSPVRTPAPEPDAEALFKEARRRRQRRRLGWVVVLLLVVAAATLVVVGRRTSSPPPPASQLASAGRHAGTSRAAPASALPADIVGWTSTFKLVVISAHSGRVLRTLASDVSIFAPGVPIVSVAPDGTVFFESATPSPENPNVAQGDQILSAPINGGPIRDLGAGSDPQVSPDGKFLAFISPVPAGTSGEAPYLVPPVGIEIATLSAGTIGAVHTLGPGPGHVNEGASDLSWSSDSRQLSMDLLNPETNTTTAWTIDASASPSSLASATEIPLHPAGLTWNGYWGQSKSGANVGLGVLASRSDGQEVVTVNPSTGRVTGRLFRVPAAVCTAAAATPGGCFSDFANSVIGDSAGANVLVAGAIPLVEGSPTTSGTAYLYRWSVGARAPTRVADQILVASWGPAS